MMMIRKFFKNLSFTRSDIGLIALVALYVLIGYIIAFRYEALGFYNPVMYVRTGIDFTKVLLMGYLVFWGLWTFYVMIFVRPAKLKDYLWQDLQRNALNLQRYKQAIPVFLAFIVMLSTFTSLKTMIPYVHHFSWDIPLADLDALLHGGKDPWRWLHPVLGYPYITQAINVVYNFWLLALYLVLYAQLLRLKDPQTRMQFFYTMVLCWAINGSFLAMIFSSGGPCFFDEITGLDRFQPLMDYLQSVGSEDHQIWALINQDNLWQEYSEKAHGIGAGISAMPSIHVATALIFMLVGLRSNRFWKIASILFFMTIMLGSVHLGWHYAIDGYVAILTTLPLWFFSGWLIKKLSRI